MLNLLGKDQLETVVYVSPGKEAIEFDFNNKEERKKLRRLLKVKGASWRVYHEKTVTQAKARRSHAPNFTTESDGDEDSRTEEAEKSRSGGTSGSGKKTNPVNQTSAKSGGPSSKKGSTIPKKGAPKKAHSVGSTSGKGKKGKKSSEDDDDEDDDESSVKINFLDLSDDDADDDAELMKLIGKKQKAGAKKPQIITLSWKFVNTLEETLKYLVVFPKFGNTFFAKVPMVQTAVQSVASKLSLFTKEDNTWLESIDFFHAREQEHGRENKWRRSGNSNSTTDLMYFVLTIPIGEEETFKDQLEKKVNLFFFTQ